MMIVMIIVMSIMMRVLTTIVVVTTLMMMNMLNMFYDICCLCYLLGFLCLLWCSMLQVICVSALWFALFVLSPFSSVVGLNLLVSLRENALTPTNSGHRSEASSMRMATLTKLMTMLMTTVMMITIMMLVMIMLLTMMNDAYDEDDDDDDARGR